MSTDRLLSFGSYHFDSRTGQLWRGKQEVRLTPKAATVPRILVTQPEQVITKEELFRVA